MGRRRMLAAALAAVAALGLVGCNAIPGSGDVETGLADLRQAEQFVQFNPLGPVAESSQEDIVRGFVLAASSNEADYAVAREFLTPAYGEQWDPSFGVVVDEGARLYSTEGESSGVLEVSAIAKVDGQGELLPIGPGPSTDMRFEFEQVDGEWRISSAPAGIILDRTTFTAVWSPHQVYFATSAGLMVPETRWYLSRASLATEIVNGLLAGPSERMGEVLHSGFPSGTALATSAVTVLDGRARIDLTAEAVEAGPDAMAEMFAQLRESLKSVPGVIGFDVLANGATIREVGGAAEQPSVPVVETLNPSVIRDGAFGTIEHGEFVENAQFGGALVEDGPTAIMLSDDGSLAASLGAHGVSRIVAGSRTVVDERPNLLAPDLDLYGYTWSTNAAGEIWVSGANGTGYALPAPWLAGFGASVVQVSPDGSRIAALAQSGDDYSVVAVAGVVRDEASAPVRTTSEADVRMWAEGDAIDFDWIDSTRFATLTREGGAGNVGVGGVGLLWNEQGSVPGGVQIASGGSRAQLRVRAADGELYASQGGGWQRSIGDISVLAKQE
ncbi:LpqB family beta-propeller domain-containing protein [Leucobacter sp. GX0328]